MFIKNLIITILVLLSFISSNLVGQEFRKLHENEFKNPSEQYWPNTRWWWPGNATSKENITYELEQMQSHGIGGVEQITMGSYYEKGNIDYLSKEYIDLAKHAVSEAKRLNMKVSFNFGGPGWIIGGDWVKEQDMSRDLIPTFTEISGPIKINMNLPDSLIKTNRSWEIFNPKLLGDEKLVAVVGAKQNNTIIDPNTLIVLNKYVSNGKILWDVPKGNWKIMCFWLAIEKSHKTVNHFDKNAMERYCNYLGGKYKEAFGNEFGNTVESFFCDSFELPYLASGIKWSNNLLEEFELKKGYDLTKYLPAIWWNVNNTSSQIRYDVNDFLSKRGYEAFFKTFLTWCKSNGIKGRIQPYGFETDNIYASGNTDIPEMEITPGEKDQHPWFDTRIGPKKFVSSGAHIYGKNIISVETNTFLHWERYRATLEEIKIATDGFLRSGANKFYTHGFSASEERDIAPTRRTGWATQINPTNSWWKYYPLLSQYIARSSFILQQGSFAPDIAIYSPLANQWCKDALNARRWTRDFDWGELGGLLISNGYDFDILNDDAIQNIAEYENGNIVIEDMVYKVLLIPNIEFIPIESLERIKQYVESGGTIIALDRLPNSATGYVNNAINNSKVKKIIKELFKNLSGKSIQSNKYGKGNTHFLKKVIHREIWWDQYSSSFDPFLKILKEYIHPDFMIDFVNEGIRKNNGLSFIHRKFNDTDIYFVSNIQDQKISMPITFRVNDKNVWNWNPYNGRISQLYNYSSKENGICLPINLAPWESTFIIFENENSKLQVTNTNMHKITSLTKNELHAEVVHNGIYFANIINRGKEQFLREEVKDIPSPFIINGEWDLVLESNSFPKLEKRLQKLTSWTSEEETRHFSGSGKYSISLKLPEYYYGSDIKLELDLGKVGNIAEVYINKKNASTVWMTGQKIDITKLLNKGKNELVVYVTNTNINRVSGLKEVTPIPEHLNSKYGYAIKGNQLPREFGFEPLPPSGLLGPVKIIPTKNIVIEYN